MERGGYGHYFAYSQLALINVREELVLKEQEIVGVLLNLNAECLREKPQLPDFTRKSWLAYCGGSEQKLHGVDVKIVQGR